MSSSSMKRNQSSNCNGTSLNKENGLSEVNTLFLGMNGVKSAFTPEIKGHFPCEDWMYTGENNVI